MISFDIPKLRSRLVAPATFFVVSLLALANIIALNFSIFDVKWASYEQTMWQITVLLALLGLSHAPQVGRILSQVWQEKVQHLIWGLIIVDLFWTCLRPFKYVAFWVAREIPMQDSNLAAADAALGLHWPAYFDVVYHHPTLWRLLDLAYDSLYVLSVVVLSFLILIGRVDRAWIFFQAFFITAITMTLVGIFFPALGSSHFFLNDMTAYPDLSKPPGTYFIKRFLALRAAEDHFLLNAATLTGFVTFPSFHTGSSVIVAYAFARTRFFWPALIYAALVIAATPIFGGHYFVDILAGAVIAYVICVITERAYNRPGTT